jgi:hypothetical protein
VPDDHGPAAGPWVAADRLARLRAAAERAARLCADAAELRARALAAAAQSRAAADGNGVILAKAVRATLAAARGSRAAQWPVVACMWCARVAVPGMSRNGTRWTALPPLAARALARATAARRVSHGLCPACLVQHYTDVLPGDAP